jgi:putative ABC transport system permease protein
MNTQWCKIAGDLRQHGVQVGLIALVIALGTAGVVAALNARAILEREITASYDASRSPALALAVDRVEPAMLELVRTHEDVDEADARRTLLTRSAGGNNDWIGTRLVIVPDFRRQSVGTVHLHDGDWSAADTGIYVEQSSWALLGLRLGDSLRVRTPGGSTVALPVVGLVHDTAVAPGFQERIVYAYVTPAAARKLGQDGSLDQILVKMKNRAAGPGRVARDLSEMFADSGYTLRRSEVLPATHPHTVLMQTMLRVLGILAAMAFACSSALAAYVVALWMKREVRQIGIMKTIGATSGRLAFQYLALVVPVVLLIALGAVPAGGALGDQLVRYNETALNIDVANRAAPPLLLAVEVALAALIPLAAMAFPVVRAARMSAREAIQDPGITAQGTPRSGLARWVRVPGSRQWTFALRNLFRRPWRLAVTLTALTAGGGLLLAANFLFASLMSVVDRSLNAQAHDLQVTFRRPLEVTRLDTILQGVRDIEIAEPWQRVGVRFGALAPGGGTPPTFRTLLTAYPTNSRLRTYPLTAGRWPADGQADAVVINRAARESINARVGDVISVGIDGRPSLKLRVTGEFEEFQGPGFYTSYQTFVALAGERTTTGFLLVKTAPGRVDQVTTDLDLAFIAANANAASLDRRSDRRQVMEEHFLGVIGICNLISVAATALGGICLAAFASLNVLERAREIGVIRALGAAPGRVTALFVAESGAVALLSALLALVVGSTLALYLNWLIETKAFKVTIPLVMEGRSLALLFCGGFLVMLGVWLPVSRLVRVSVRDALSYE